MRHFISVNQLSESEIFRIMKTAENYRENNIRYDRQLFAANLFFEPSTRTKVSFTVAEKKLGLDVLDFHSEFSATKKGETLYDTVKTFESIGADLIVIRHEADEWIEELDSKINVPIINAGAGKKEHPTQCLLDLLTIYQEFNRFKGLSIVIAGDIKHSRVAHSNARVLQRLGVKVYLSAAPGFEDETMDFPYISMDEAADICDVVMLLRIQHERHLTDYPTAKDYLEQFGMTKEREKRMKSHAIILHPAPVNRGVEIDSDLVECERSRIFKQMNNGVYVRMAIISNILNEWGIQNETAFEEHKTLAAN